MEKLPPTLEIRCGTNEGYRAHRTRREKSCDACRIAANLMNAKWKRDNPSKVNLANLTWKHNNTEKVKKSGARYRAENREKIRKSFLLHHVNNPDSGKDSASKYHKKNPDIARRAGHRRRANKRNNKSEIYTEAQVLNLYGTDCHICKKPVDLTAPRRIGFGGWQWGLHIDHIIPVAKGGEDTVKNVKPSHGICNLRKGAA